MNYIKIIKFIIVSIAMTICIMLPGELYQNYAANFDESYEVTFVTMQGISREEMLNDISAAAKRNNIIIYSVKDMPVSAIKTQIIIYADKQAEKYIDKEYGIRSGLYQSLISGETEISVIDFSEIPLAYVNTENRYKIVGSEDDMMSFKEELVGKYHGEYPHISSYGARSDTVGMIVSAWVMLILLCVFFSAYDCMFQKKESAVCASLGERTGVRILKMSSRIQQFFQ